MSKLLAVHFLTERMTPKIGSGKPWTVGEERSVRGNLVLCQRGFHYCHTWKDALLGNFLYGPNACVVEVDDGGPKDEHKGCSRTRKLVHVVNVEREMRLFAAEEASRCLKQWEKSSGKKADACSWAAVKAARAFANGKIDADELSAAWSAALSAAESAAWSAAESAALSAARSAAWSAARSAAEGAARSAARSASAARFAAVIGNATGYWDEEAAR